ncbi:MAG: 6-carboxytetrahydropterin synthase QueD [Candidatus Aureabacteria bacterium]|nr:6-carboxytetrahydropterin synthase QueD [Candidatus Auribacterota bacterium]
MELKKIFTFDAAHFLPCLPESHPCSKMHGHHFKIAVSVKGKVRSGHGWVMDYGEIKEKTQPLIQQLDHSVLNDIPGLENPTSEQIALWFWNRLKSRLDLLNAIEVWESETSQCIYRGESVSGRNKLRINPITSKRKKDD